MNHPIGITNDTNTRSSNAATDIHQNGNENDNIIQNNKNSNICPKSYALGYQAGKMKAMEIVGSALREVNDEYERHKQNMGGIIARLTNHLNNL